MTTTSQPAALWAPNKAYRVGEFVKENDVWWRCTVAHTSGIADMERDCAEHPEWWKQI